MVDKMTVFMERKLRSIMRLDPGGRETSLREYAKELGCSLSSSYIDGKHLEADLVTRIREAIRSVRESRTWWIAFVSAIASVLSAFAAWVAAWKH